MKTISVQMSDVEYDTLGLSKDRFCFSEITGLIERQMVQKTLPFSAGLWADYDIDDRALRSKTWGTHKRAAL